MLAGCAAPTSQPADSGLTTLWVVDVDAVTPAEQVLAVTLQGLVADGTSAIWLADDGINAIILDDLAAEGVDVRTAQDVWALLDVFRERVRGVVIFDLDEADSLNVATSLCGPLQAVAVDVSLLDKVRADGLEVLLDVRGRDALWAFETYRADFARGILVEQTESKPAFLRDFAVARHAFTYYNVSPEAYAEFATALGPNPLVFGWGGDEHAWVQRVSRSGGAGIAADWSRNLSVLARLPVDLPERPHRHPEPAKEGERIVAFVMSDGDNIQWMGGNFATDTGFWASEHRGTFPMTWEMAPILAEVSPRVLAYFYGTASDTRRAVDDFVVGPSGVGYSYHNDLPDRSAFAETTARYMQMSDLAIVTLLNSGGGMEQSVELLEQPQVMGVIYKDYSPYNAKEGRVFWHEGKPCVAYRYLLWEPKRANSPEGVAQAIAKLPADPQNDPDSYALINVHAWSFKDIGGPMEAVKRTIDRLPRKTRVVTAEEFFILLRENFGTAVAER